jgi:hypothetical protein
MKQAITCARDGLFSTDRWEEERVANQLAIAFTKHRLTLAQRQELQQTMGNAITNLAALWTGEGDAVATHSAIQSATYSGAGHLVGYVYTHMCWLYADLTAQEGQSMARFARTHLQGRDHL